MLNASHDSHMWGGIKMHLGACNTLNFLQKILLPVLLAGVLSPVYAGDVWIEGYHDENGNYVEPHYLFRTQAKQFDTKTNPADKSDLYYELTNAHDGYVKRNPGVRSTDSTPNEIEMPENAQLNFFGTGWECKRGYLRQGDVCEEMEIPENARLNSRGTDWLCLPGYVRQDSRC
jgi:hypothetical protein